MLPPSEIDGEHSEAIDALRELILAGEAFRHGLADYLHVGVTETVAMSYLYSQGDQGQKELAERIGINTSSMTSVVDRMEAKGIVARTPHADDRRRCIIHLTDYGRAMLVKTRPLLGSVLEDVPVDLNIISDAMHLIADGLRTRVDELAAQTD